VYFWCVYSVFLSKFKKNKKWIIFGIILGARSQNCVKQLFPPSCLSACLPVCTHEQLGFHWKDFPKIRYLKIFRKHLEKNSSLRIGSFCLPIGLTQMLGWYHVTEAFNCPHSSLYNILIGTKVFFWILDLWRWNQYVAPKHRQEIIYELEVLYLVFLMIN